MASGMVVVSPMTAISLQPSRIMPELTIARYRFRIAAARVAAADAANDLAALSRWEATLAECTKALTAALTAALAIP